MASLLQSVRPSDHCCARRRVSFVRPRWSISRNQNTGPVAHYRTQHGGSPYWPTLRYSVVRSRWRGSVDCQPPWSGLSVWSEGGFFIGCPSSIFDQLSDVQNDLVWCIVAKLCNYTDLIFLRTICKWSQESPTSELFGSIVVVTETWSAHARFNFVLFDATRFKSMPFNSNNEWYNKSSVSCFTRFGLSLGGSRDHFKDFTVADGIRWLRNATVFVIWFCFRGLASNFHMVRYR